MVCSSIVGSSASYPYGSGGSSCAIAAPFVRDQLRRLLCCALRGAPGQEAVCNVAARVYPRRPLPGSGRAGREMLLRPDRDLLERREQGLAAVGDEIGDRDRRSVFDGPRDQPGGSELGEPI